MYNQILGHRNHWDSAGVGASFLCVAHCLVTPLLATALPVLASIEGETHRFFSIIILLLGMLAFIPGYREHKNKIIPALGFTGISLIIFAAMLPEMESVEMIETGMVITGGITLIFSHLSNAYWCRFCNPCNSEENCCGLSKG